MAPTGLFGGAIVAELPARLIDVSDIRQVPDTQEVFLYPDSNASIVIEVLQRVEKQDDKEAVIFHFEALAHDNEAISSAMEPPTVVPNDRGDRTPSPVVLHGSQRIRKFHATVADDVDILIALFRVHTGGKRADVVVSASIPKGSEGGVGEDRTRAIASEFDTLVSSLRIVDFDLFPDFPQHKSDTCTSRGM